MLNLLHPARVAIIEALTPDRVASPNVLSKRIGVSLGSTAYHVRAMVDAGVLELVNETRVRGAVEHHYRLHTNGNVEELSAGLLQALQNARRARRGIERVRPRSASRPHRR